MENVITVLEKGFREYGTPEEILTDGTQFVASRNRDEARHTFKEFLEMKGIGHIVAGSATLRPTARSNDSSGKWKDGYRSSAQWREWYTGIT